MKDEEIKLLGYKMRAEALKDGIDIPQTKIDEFLHDLVDDRCPECNKVGKFNMIPVDRFGNGLSVLRTCPNCREKIPKNKITNKLEGLNEGS